MNETRVNLTCFVYGNSANSAVFLSAKNDSENIYKETQVVDNDVLIRLNEKRAYMDLPAVLDKQWETFPWHSMNESIKLLRGEYKWISFKQTHSSSICVYSTKCIEIKNNAQNAWRHIQLHYNGTHFKTSGDIEKSIKVENIKDFLDIKLKDNYRIQDYTILQHNSKIEFKFSIENLQWHYIQVSFFICNGCKIYIKFETNTGERLDDVLKYENKNNEFHWYTQIVKNKNLNVKTDLLDSKITLVANLENTLSNDQRFMVLRNLLVSYGERRHYVSKIAPFQDVNQYSCETIDPFTSISNGQVNATKKNIVHNIRNSKFCEQHCCYCSIGSIGEFCERNCDVGYWDDCKTICDCCDIMNSCNSFTGVCLYPESDCSKSKSVRNIKVLETTANKITANVLVDKKNLQKQINVIRIEYQKNEVLTTSHYLKLDDDYHYFELTNLGPSVTYEIGATLCKDEVCFSENAFRIRVKTRCNAPLESEYFINSTNSKILLNLNKKYIDDKGSCAKVCGINLKDTDIILRGVQTEIVGLQSYSLYNVSVWCDGVNIDTKSISTAANVPGKVINLKLLNNTISWSEPIKENNPISSYMVSINRYGSVICDAPVTLSKFKSNGTSFILPELEAFSKYKIFVQTCNEKGCGHNTSFNHTTPPLDELSLYDQPETFYLNSTHYIIKFNHCDGIQVPFVNFKIDFACLDIWCNNTQRITDEFKLVFKKSTSLYEHPFKEGLLIPYTHYGTIAKMYRNKRQFLIASNNIRTAQACPPAVRNLSIYSRSHNSISLRWKKPFPPHGILKKYTFSYSYGSISTYYDKDIHDIRKCDLWDDTDYFCWTVEELQMKPSLIITASNEFTSNCKTGVYLTNIKLEQTASDPPQNISVEWKTDKLDELLIKWMHPNKSNGKLKFFNLKFVDELKNICITENVTVFEETANYSFIWTKFNESSKYNLSATAVNQFEGTPAIFEQFILTPPPYPEIDENITYTVNGSICSLEIPFAYYMLENSSSLVILLYGSNCRTYTQFYQSDTSRDELMTFEKDNDIICYYQASDDQTNNTILLNLDEYLDFTSFDELLQDANFKLEVLLVNKFEQYTRTSKYTAQLSGISVIDNEYNQSKASMFPFDLKQVHFHYWVIFVASIVVVLTTIFVIFVKRRYFKSENYFHNTHEVIYDRNSESLRLVPISNIIKQTDFGHYMYAAIESGDLNEEYNSVPVQFSYISTMKFKNGIKADNGNIPEWNIISGYKCAEAYITMPNPTLQTVGEFWKKIFENKVPLIVMLNGEENCFIYWPYNKQTNIFFGNIEIELKNEFHYTNYIERFIRISDGFVHYELKHLQYLAWPQYDVPKNQFSLSELLRVFHNGHNYENPAVIHSSCGVGRTGTLILSDYILRMARDVAVVDFLLVLNNLRRERNHFVETKEQYQLAHVIVNDYLFMQKARLVCDDSFEDNLKTVLNTDEIITEQFDYLQKMIEIDSGLHNEIANKMSNIVYIGTNNATNDKLFCSHIDSEQTIGKFWENIIETNCSVLVVLEKLEIAIYPEQMNNHLKIDGNISLYLCSCTNFGWYNKLIIKLKLKFPNKEYLIEIVQMHDSSMDQDITRFIQFYKYFKLHYTNRNISTAIICSNGYRFSGLFIAYHFIIEKLLTDQICDVISVVREIRYKNQSFIYNKRQLKLIYFALLGAIDMFKLYHSYDTIGYS